MRIGRTGRAGQGWLWHRALPKDEFLALHWLVGYRMQLFLYAKRAGNGEI